MTYLLIRIVTKLLPNCWEEHLNGPREKLAALDGWDMELNRKTLTGNFSLLMSSPPSRRFCPSSRSHSHTLSGPPAQCL